MLDTKTFLISLYRRGIKISSENGRLHIQAPTGGLSPDELNTLRVLKSEIINFLEQIRIAPEISIRVRRSDLPVPLTPFQLRFWAEGLACGTRHSYRMCSFALHIVGPLNVISLQSSIQAVIHRHESLRTTVIVVDCLPRQHISSPHEYQLELIDLTGELSNDATDRARSIAHEFMSAPIDVSVGPLFEAKLLKLLDDEHVLILALDHLITDGFSNELINSEIWAFYDHFEHGAKNSLPCVSIQLADYALWQQQTYDAWREKHKDYWIARLTNAPRVEFPFNEQVVDSRRPTTFQIQFSDETSGQLRDMARHAKSDVSLVISAIFAAIVFRWHNQRDLVFGFISNGRWCSELQNTIGWLASVLYLRVTVEAGCSFLDLLAQVTEEYYSAYDHQDFNRVPDLIPGFMCNLVTVHWPFAGSLLLPDGRGQWHDQTRQIRVEGFAFDETPPSTHGPAIMQAYNWKLHLESSEAASGIVAWVRGPPDVFPPCAIASLGHNLQSFTEEVSRYPHMRVGDVSFKVS